VTATRFGLDDHFPAWGDSPYFTVELSAERRLSELLRHLYVLIPVLDDDKHYWVGEAEVEKLLRHGEGWLLAALLAEKQFEEIAGVDVSSRTLERAADRLRLEQLPPKQRERVRVFQGALTYRDRRLQGFDAAAVAEVIEHLDPPRLDAFARVLFERVDLPGRQNEGAVDV